MANVFSSPTCSAGDGLVYAYSHPIGTAADNGVQGGHRSMTLDNGTSSGMQNSFVQITKTLTTVIGQTYTVAYQTSWSGSGNVSFSFLKDGSGSATTFVATGTSTQITIRGTQLNQLGAYANTNFQIWGLTVTSPSTGNFLAFF